MEPTKFAQFQQLLPLIIPLVIIQLILIVVGLRDLIHQPATRGPKWVWALVIPFLQIIGPVLYFTLGRKE